ncbi:MAG: metal ABC transporter permease, partial [Candidatus Moranbacteria bacterium]|nr:metal ABC transporter permease [Candidatus Moranbacteria bacterium]
ALQIARSFRAAIFLSVALSVLSVLFGITLSFFADLPAGGTVILTNLVVFFLLAGWKHLG